MEPMRLQKYLSAAGVCSRRKAEVLIAAGRVSINGETVARMGTRVDPRTDRVRVDGRAVRLQRKQIYIALHKPVGVVTSCSHPGERTVLDLVDVGQRVYPVGRLDKDSTGLLLLTNDGRLHHGLLHPSFDHEKEYEVRVDRVIADGALRHLAKGVVLKGRRTQPARVRRLSGRVFRIILTEGRNRQVRRMVRKVGCRVTSLKRVRVACIQIGDLPAGSWRYLTAEEQNRLLKGIVS